MTKPTVTSRVLRALWRLLRGTLIGLFGMFVLGVIAFFVIGMWGRFALERRLHAASTRVGGQGYFIDPAGDDANDGKSRERAWKTLARANSTSFAPGDSLVLTGGAEYQGTIKLTEDDGGDPARPFILTSSGERPAIIVPGDSDGVRALNPIGLTIRRLVVRGSGASSNKGSGFALLVNAPGSVQLPGIIVEEVEASGMGRFGLVADGRWLKSGIRDLHIRDSDFHGNQLAGLSILGLYIPFDRRFAHADVFVEGVRAWDNAGDPTLDKEHSGSGIVMSNVRRGAVRRCVTWNNGSASRGRLGGPYGIWTWDADSILIEHSVSFANRTSSKADGGGFDFDGGTTYSTMRDNVSFDNDGAGVLIAQFTYATPFHNNRIERQVSIDDGRKNGYGALTTWGAVESTELHSSVLSVRSSAPATAAGVQVYTNWWKHWWERAASRDIRVVNSLIFVGPGIDFLRVEAGAIGLDVSSALEIHAENDDLPKAAKP